MEVHGIDQFSPEDAISAIGFGKFQVGVLVFAGLGWISEAMEMMLLPIVGIAVQSEWGLSPGEESLLSTVVFLGMLFGAYFWGSLSDSYGRRKGFTGNTVVVAIAGICSSLSPSYRLLLASRCLLGFGVGGGHVFAAWFLEFIPAPNRGAWAFILTCFFSFGSIIEAALMWIIMPRWGWRWLIALSCFPSFVVLILSRLAPESPRYLCVKGEMEEARQILERVATVNNTNLPHGVLVLDQKIQNRTNSDYDQENAAFLDTSAKVPGSGIWFSSVRSLFSAKLRKTTMLLWILFFANTFAYYGLVLLTSELSNTRNSCSSTPIQGKNGVDSSLYRDVFITTLADFPGFAMSAVLVDRLGRKLTMKIFCILGFIMLLPLILPQNEVITTALLFGARMFVVSTFNVVGIYAREVYPTSVRATGVGSATAIGRIGGMICPLVGVGLIRGCHQTEAIILFESVIVLIGFCIPFLPIETCGKGLSDTVHQTEAD